MGKTTALHLKNYVKNMVLVEDFFGKFKWEMFYNFENRFKHLYELEETNKKHISYYNKLRGLISDWISGTSPQLKFIKLS